MIRHVIKMPSWHCMWVHVTTLVTPTMNSLTHLSDILLGTSTEMLLGGSPQLVRSGAHLLQLDVRLITTIVSTATEARALLGHAA